MVLAWFGVLMLLRKVRRPVEEFNLAKRVPIVALTTGMLMWMVAFLTIGAEWFLMWQSRIWNGQEAAFRMFVVLGIVLSLVMHPDREGQA